LNGKENLSLSECRHPDRRAAYLDALRGASRRQGITEVLAPLAARCDFKRLIPAWAYHLAVTSAEGRG
jgi:hypothetical protein